MPENMYCPRCGKIFSDRTSYCRSCGLSLAGVNEIVKGDAANAPQVSKGPNGKALRFGIGLFICGTVLGLAHTVLRDLDIFPEIYGKAIFMAFIIAGFLTIGSAFVFPSKKYKKRNPNLSVAETVKNEQFKTAPLADQLQSADIIDINAGFSKKERQGVLAEHHSVTEDTTRNLK